MDKQKYYQRYFLVGIVEVMWWYNCCLRQVTGAIVGCCFILVAMGIYIYQFLHFLSTANKPAQILQSTINALTHFQSNSNQFFFILQRNMSFIWCYTLSIYNLFNRASRKLYNWDCSEFCIVWWKNPYLLLSIDCNKRRLFRI